jgi:glycosyltransferase involved in cell wall biosynthesis
MAAENRRLAVYTGHLYTGRGIELLIDLARKMKDHFFLIVGGSDSDIARFRNETEGMENLEFVGFKPPALMFTYLRAADVLLMPYSETIHVHGGGNTAAFASPMKMFEYMAAGRPILASTLPVLKEVLKDEVNALLLPCDQTNAWIDALRRLAQQPEFANSIAQQARLDVEQYTWENRAQRFVENCAT